MECDAFRDPTWGISSMSGLKGVVRTMGSFRGTEAEFRADILARGPEMGGYDLDEVLALLDLNVSFESALLRWREVNR